MKKTVAMLLLSTTIATTSYADAYNIINNLPIDCEMAHEQWDFLENERSTIGDKLKASAYSKTTLGGLIAQFTGKSEWAYITGSGTRDAVIDFKQNQIREYCWDNVPIGY